jgi:cupin fold WbuC family metalloprotein
MNELEVSELSDEQIQASVRLAAQSPRRRHVTILHERGAELNRAVNVLMQDSYMQPHLHPGPEKIEKITLLRGSLAQLFFDDGGALQRVVVLAPGGQTRVEVPAFSWHTYVMLSGYTVTYETMMGVYDPATWKRMAPWAPPENAQEAPAYFQRLKSAVQGRT